VSHNLEEGRLRFLRRASSRRRRRFHRGVALLPGLLTVGNMFCGYACVIYTMRGAYETAALFIGAAILLDMFDGRIARLTGTTSDFGAQFDSLADVISFGVAPAVLAFGWGLAPLGRLGWAAGFLHVTAAAMRLARFNIQSGGDKRYFVGMPSPPAAGVTAATVFAYPAGFSGSSSAIPVLVMVLVPAFLMVSTIRFRSFKTIDLQVRRPYTVLLLLAVGITLIVIQPRIVLAGMAYVYLASGFIGLALSRLRHREPESPAGADVATAGAADEDRAAR
jgi:CDP-diacylglycerol--serine O-phosphatidyltransferase